MQSPDVRELTDAEIRGYFDSANALDGDRASTLRLYAEWAPVYDEVIARAGRYLSPGRIAQLLADNLTDRRSPILDLACGSGLLGTALASAGFTNLFGIDLSKAMLDRAAAKACYRLLVAGDLYQPLPFPSESFGGMACIGAFTLGHVKAEALSKIMDVLQPGGVLACDINFGAWNNYGFREQLSAMLAGGTIASIERHPGSFLDVDDEQHGWFVIVRKSGGMPQDRSAHQVTHGLKPRHPAEAFARKAIEKLKSVCSGARFLTKRR